MNETEMFFFFNLDNNRIVPIYLWHVHAYLHLLVRPIYFQIFEAIRGISRYFAVTKLGVWRVLFFFFVFAMQISLFSNLLKSVLS